jgi:hypothetical protein
MGLEEPLRDDSGDDCRSDDHGHEAGELGLVM